MTLRQRPTITCWITCDVCGEDARDEWSEQSAQDRTGARADGFVQAPDGRDLCERCAEKEGLA